MTRSQAGVREVLDRHDLLFSVGGDLFTWSLPSKIEPMPPGMPLIHLDTDPWQIGKNYPAQVGILGDPKATLPDITAAVRAAHDAPAPRPPRPRASRPRPTPRKAEREALVAKARALAGKTPVQPLALLEAIGAMLPKDAVVIEEILSSAPGARSLINSDDAQSFFALRGGGIGWGLPAAIGAKLALPDRPVVALIGDGSAMYTVQALWTAAHSRVPVIWVIFNNTSYRILKQRVVAMRGAAEQTDTFVGMELNDPAIDFVGLARSLGIKAERAKTVKEATDLIAQGAQGQRADADRRRHGPQLQAGVSMPRIAVFTKNRTNPAYAAARLGADRTAARFGATTAHYVPEVPDSVPEQIALIERAIAEKPDAAVFVPCHETAVNDAILRLRRGEHSAVQHHHADHRGPARHLRRLRRPRAGEEHRALSVRKDGRARHASSSSKARPPPPPAIDRLAGFQDALAEHHGDQGALLAARRIPARHRARRVPRRARTMAGHRRRALRQRRHGARRARCAGAGRVRTFVRMIVGVNAIPEAVAAIASGSMLATANFDAMAMSEIATEAAVRHLRGERVPAEIILPVQVVDAANCATWNAPFEARPSPVWDVVTRWRDVRLWLRADDLRPSKAGAQLSSARNARMTHCLRGDEPRSKHE